MKYILKYLLVLIFNIIWLSSFSQDTKQDQRLAMNYFNEGDFDKAVMYFDKIYSKDNAKEIYKPYKITLIELNRYKDAEKLCKQQVKENPKKLGYLVELGKIYEAWEKNEKAKDSYDLAVKKINEKSNHSQISELALAFEKEGMIDEALHIYILGNKYSKSNQLIYNQKIAYIYGRKGETELMISTLLDLIEFNERYISVVQRVFGNSIDLQNDLKKRELLKTAILKRSQKHPSSIVYNELLAWYFSAINDFDSAFIQVKAIDKKSNAKGVRLLELGESCYVNEKYDAAIKCFNEIIARFPESEIAGKAKAKNLKALKSNLLSGGNVSKEQLLDLKKNYLITIEEIKKYFDNYERDPRYISVIRDLSELEAYYIHDYSSAETHLRNVMSSPGISEKAKGDIKIELADILVLQGRVWDASLLYMQVEKEFKHDALGHQAKFKNAKIYYYTGEFEWCQAQLDVLKASTSKLISNDAMELSLLITDNFNLDTSRVTMNLFAKADLLIIQHKFTEVRAIYDTINKMYGYHSLNDDILLRKAKIYIKEQRYNEAVDALNKLLSDYSDDILADNALFILGELYEKKIKDLEKAKECYKKILFEHGGSLFVVEARKRYRKLSGKRIEEIKNKS